MSSTDTLPCVNFTVTVPLRKKYANGCLSVTQRRGLITLIPKKNKDAKLLKNWRPVTLLNCDYKIASKSVANRFKKLLPKLIDYDQTGFQKKKKGLLARENIRLIDSIITYAREKNLPGLLLFVDFEKAFDSLEWTFNEKTSAHFKFGSSLRAKARKNRAKSKFGGHSEKMFCADI